MDIRTNAAAGYQLWPCITTSSGIGGYGSIELESNWQLVSVPIRRGYWSSATHEHIHDDVTIAKFENYILDQITDLYGTDIVEVANTFPGDLQAFLSYVVGSTPTSSPHNFNLVTNDNGNLEIAGFWIKIIGPNPPYIITWGSE